MEEEYEIQHYGFSIAELKKETTDMIHEEVDKACDVLVDSITTSPQVKSDVASEIDRKKNILASDIKTLIKESLEEMGNVITEHFSIPPNVTLSTDQFKLKRIDASEKELQEQYDDLLKLFMALEQFNSTLKHELETYENMASLIEMQEYAIVVAEETMATVTNLNYIKELSATVKTNFNE